MLHTGSTGLRRSIPCVDLRRGALRWTAEPSVFSPRKTSDDAAQAQVAAIWVCMHEDSIETGFKFVSHLLFFSCLGDVLYEILQCVKQQRRSVVCNPPNPSPPGPSIIAVSGHFLNPVTPQNQNHKVQEHLPPTVNGSQGQYSPKVS